MTVKALRNEPTALMEQTGLLRVLVLFHETELLGAGKSVLNVVEPLGEYGWSVCGWTPGPGRLAEAASEYLAATTGAPRPLAVSLRGLRDHPGVVDRVRATPRYLASVRSALLRARPHVVHANTLRSLPEACVARSLGLPVVIHVHELPPPTTKRTAALWLAGRVGDVLVSVSDAVATVVRPYTQHLLTVRNGVPTTRSKTAEAKQPFTVGTIGTVSRLKGTDVFFRAAELVVARRPGVRFEHVGQSDQHRERGLDEELSAALSKPSLRASAAMLGRVDPPASVLARWDLFALPSRMDSFPLASLEAMATGVPVVASRVGGIPEQIDHLEHGVLIPPDDPRALADWIVRLHDDQELRAKLAARALQRVRSEFSIESQARGLHRAYLAALNRRFAPSVIRALAGSA